MRATKKLTVSAMATALGCALMAPGAVWEMADLACAALAALVMIVIMIEVRGFYPFLVWISTTLLSFLLFISLASPIWVMYLVMGIYPILKFYIEKLKRPLWIPLKLAYSAVAIFGLVLAVELIFAIPLVESEYLPVKIAFYALFLVAFMMYDRVVTVAARFYTYKLRNRFKNLFK